MLIDSLAKALQRGKPVREMTEMLDAGGNPAVAVPPTARSLVVASVYCHDPRPMLVVVPGTDAARKFSLELSLYLGRDKVLLFPMEDVLPWDDKDVSADVVGQRLRALSLLNRGDDLVVVASTRALMRLYPPREKMVFDPLTLVSGCEVEGFEYEQLPAELQRLGYHREDVATEKGTFSVHGDSMDIFGSDALTPVRVEFFGDEVERIRKIMPSTGQTVSDLERATIYPAREVIVSNRDIKNARAKLSRAGILTYDLEAQLEQMGHLGMHGSQAQFMPFLFDQTCTPMQFVHPRTLMMMIEPRALFDDATHYHDELKAAAKQAKVSLDGLFASPAELKFDNAQMMSVLSLIRAATHVDSEIRASRAEMAGSGERFLGQLRALLADQYTVVVGVGERRMREDLELELTDQHIPIRECKGPDPVFDRKVVNIVETPVPQGVVVPASKLALFGTIDAMDSMSSRANSVRQDASTLTFPYKPGDYVVHIKHGVAKFTHMEKQQIDGIWRDYLVLEYAAGDKLFIPVEQIGKVTKYVGAAGVEPKLTRLDTNDWSRAQKKASKAARKLAFDLVDLYVRRSSVQGYAYSPDTEMQQQMESLFAYEETTDQAKAIADVKADMESTRPMDRLICGDVGYGKTEVAIRAAFKAVQDGMQVMVLCPTTILAQQHFTTFSERFESFPVNVDILSRFRTPAQQRKTLEGFANGTVDVLVGTHRLLSRDVAPKRLGLVVIDEEQRFGVKHKEQMKNLREHIDVLTLTATPIPRTLQMSLGGIREMSIIDTPPQFRVPVEVYVGEYDEDVTSGAIRRELARGGQVYYVATRIANIDDAVAKVHELAPEARVGFAHGRLKESQMESVMESFSAGQIDVLVSTTIIESGIDNPHTNTLIIEDSHKLGLAQLYQLKGRVGRSHVKAYAYFMFPRDIALTQEAQDRLIAIRENQDFGSGIKIAMRDLEIRGAGSLLGAEQSGNISAIGFEAFTAMLSDYVSEARGGQRSPALDDVVVDLPAEVYLPEDYISQTEDRVALYRRFALSRSQGDVARAAQDMAVSYGPAPQQALNLVGRTYLQLMMHELGVQRVSYVGGKVVIEPLALSVRGRQAAQNGGAVYFAKSQKAHLRPHGTDDIYQQVLKLLTAIENAEHPDESSQPSADD